MSEERSTPPAKQESEGEPRAGGGGQTHDPGTIKTSYGAGEPPTPVPPPSSRERPASPD